MNKQIKLLVLLCTIFRFKNLIEVPCDWQDMSDLSLSLGKRQINSTVLIETDRPRIMP